MLNPASLVQIRKIEYSKPIATVTKKISNPFQKKPVLPKWVRHSPPPVEKQSPPPMELQSRPSMKWQSPMLPKGWYRQDDKHTLFGHIEIPSQNSTPRNLKLPKESKITSRKLLRTIESQDSDSTESATPKTNAVYKNQFELPPLLPQR